MHLYKYRGGDDATFNRDLKSLIENYYWSAEIHTLNDPCEALINSSAYFEDLDVLEKAVHTAISNDIDLNSIRIKTNDLLAKVMTVGVFSLSKNYNDELMWSHYAAAHHGFCVGYNMHYLQRSLKKYFYDLLEVSYVQEPPELKIMEQMLSRDKETGLKQLIGTKSLKWKNEEEVRIVSDSPGAHQYDYRSADTIYFGLRMTEEHKYLTMSALKGRNIKYYQMEMMKGAYQFTAVPIADKYASAEKYLYKIAPIMAGATDDKDIKAHFRKHAAYLQKAAEIARREPYCIEVIVVGFSFTCPVDQPIVFAHCNITDQGYGNFEYSLPEIDKLYNEIQDL